MDFSAQEDIEAPIEFVFGKVSDFPSFERSIMRRGADVERLSGGDAPVVGAAWRVSFRMRGREREVDAELVAVDAPNGLSLDLTSDQVDGGMQIELVALSRARTRLLVKTSLKPKSLQARLLFQSLKFARQKTVGRYKSTVAKFAEDVEESYRS